MTDPRKPRTAKEWAKFFNVGPDALRLKNAFLAAIEQARLEGFELGREMAAQTASATSFDEKYQEYWPVPFKDMNESAQTATHATAQSIAGSIRELKLPPRKS